MKGYLHFVLFMILMLSIAVGIQLMRVTLPTAISLAVFVAAISLDFVTTWKCLKAGGREGNPIVAGLFKKIGVRNTMLCTAGVWVLILVFRWLPGTLIGQTSTAIVYWIVPLNNIMVLRREQKKLQDRRV